MTLFTVLVLALALNPERLAPQVAQPAQQPFPWFDPNTYERCLRLLEDHYRQECNRELRWAQQEDELNVARKKLGEPPLPAKHPNRAAEYARKADDIRREREKLFPPPPPKPVQKG